MLHTSPSSLHPSKNLGYWKTIDDDYHWHIEILPVIGSKARSQHLQRGLLFARKLRALLQSSCAKQKING